MYKFVIFIILQNRIKSQNKNEKNILINIRFNLQTWKIIFSSLLNDISVASLLCIYVLDYHLIKCKYLSNRCSAFSTLQFLSYSHTQ